jgi:hypothetical protein
LSTAAKAIELGFGAFNITMGVLAKQEDMGAVLKNSMAGAT